MDIYEEFSDFYDIYVGDRLDDLPFYLEYARSVPGPVLEIGAGSGRLTIPLARAAVAVVGADSSPSMLAILRSRLTKETSKVRSRIRIVEADARSFDLGMEYDLIIVPFYTFNYLLTPQAQNAALERFSRHLSGQGYLLMDVFLPLSRIEHCSPEPVLKVDTLDPETGSEVRGWNIYSIDRERQIEFRRHIFEVTQPDGTASKKEFATQRRYLFRWQLNELFLDGGFSVEGVHTEYRGELADANAEQLLYVLRHQ